MKEKSPKNIQPADQNIDGEIALPFPERSSKVNEILFIVGHLPLIIETIQIQKLATHGTHSLPKGVNIEDFANMSVIDAAKALKPQKEPNIVWSETDQQRMAEGKLPKNPPIHTNL